MTTETCNDTKARAVTATERANFAFETAIEVLQESCQKLKKDPTIGEVDVTKAVRQMNGALLLTMDMQEKAREAGIKRFGNADAGKLDLDQARSEIRVRLACLRGRGNGGGVSEQPE